MRVTIDTERKVVEIGSTIKLVDLIDELKELLGKDWKEYSIEYQWNYYPYFPSYPIYPTYPITYTDSNVVGVTEYSDSMQVDIIRN